jgi:hypothetical protein
MRFGFPDIEASTDVIGAPITRYQNRLTAIEIVFSHQKLAPVILPKLKFPTACLLKVEHVSPLFPFHFSFMKLQKASSEQAQS